MASMSGSRNLKARNLKLIGAQPGRWRVWALDDKSVEGVKSDWCEFTYTK